MDPHRVQVLHVADGDAVVGAVPDHLVFDLFPADQRPFQEYLGDGAGRQARLGCGLELLFGVRDAATAAAEGVSRANDQGKPHPVRRLSGLLQGAHGDVLRFRLGDFVQEAAEELAVFGAADRLQGGAQHADVIPVQHPGVGQGHRQVEAGLPSQRGQEAIGPLPPYDSFEDFDGERLDEYVVGDALVGHDRCRVGIDQDCFDALFPEGFAGLGAGVIELRSLANDDWAGADYQHLFWFNLDIGLPLRRGAGRCVRAPTAASRSGSR